MIEYQKIALTCSPTDKVPAQCDDRRFTSFVTEDTGGGYETPPVVTEDRGWWIALAVITSFLIIDIGVWWLRFFGVMS